MSLSQKHTGKVLVPWFNIAEWKTVYNLLYSDAQNLPKALDILKIWKIRTPLLSAGVEGTLLVLEALLVDQSRHTSYETTQVFSTSLVRFLNLCAANSDKQGTFYKTAKKNDLPKWLVSIRHDIAHGHKLPSKSMLEMSLKFCLNWLKEKYWDVQDDCMSDFIANPKCSTILEDTLYVHLHQDELDQKNKKLAKSVSKLLIGGFMHNTNQEIVQKTNNLLREAIKSNKDDSAERICAFLMNDYAILKVECEINDSGIKRISPDSLDKWSCLLNIIYECEILPYFVSSLFQLICNDQCEFILKEIASLWIRAIFRALNNKENNEKNKSDLRFNATNDSMKTKRFASDILEHPNPLILNFLKEVLEYNVAPPEFIKSSVGLIKTFNQPNLVENNEILTIDNLNINIQDIALKKINHEEPPVKKSRWTLIEDTKPYAELPLGVLPHQSRITNPVLDM